MRDELWPSASKAFNQSEEMLELNVKLKDVDLKMYLKTLAHRMCAKRAANLAGLDTESKVKGMGMVGVVGSGSNKIGADALGDIFVGAPN